LAVAENLPETSEFVPLISTYPIFFRLSLVIFCHYAYTWSNKYLVYSKL
jgi:hypothetical protein